MKLELTSKPRAYKISHGIAGGYFLQPAPKLITMLLLTLLGMLGTYLGGIKWAILLTLAFIALPPILAVVWKTQIGIYILITISFFLSVALRLITNIPIGLFIDFLILLMLIGKGYQLQHDRAWYRLKSPLTLVLLIWVGYNLAQIANPWAASRTAFFYVIRPAVGYLMLYFFIWDTIKGTKAVNNIFQYILLLGWIAAIWGIYQFFFGYFEWEMAHVLRTETVHLVFNEGRWRSFGPIGSPAQYGIIMALLACVTSNSFFYKKNILDKFILAFLFICFLLAMVYSGTRASFVILPIFYFVKVLLSRNKKMYFTIIFGIVGLILFSRVPTNNYQIQRIQSVFRASEDKSFQVRSANRKMITPWILRHPIGGGLGSTGVWGQRFSPGTFLANFPPDSGIIRAAVELGWIGLIIFMTIYIVAFYRGMQGFWIMKNNKHKDKVEGIICILPALAVVELGQEVVGVFPMSLLFWAYLAILFTILKYDHEEA